MTQYGMRHPAAPTEAQTYDATCSSALVVFPGPRPRCALQNNPTNSLMSGIRGLERHEGSSKAILHISGICPFEFLFRDPQRADRTENLQAVE